MEISNDKLIYNHRRYLNPHESSQYFMQHSHNAYEIIFFETGDASYVIEDRRYELKKGDFIFIRSGKYHYVEIKSKAEYSRYNVAFDSSFVGKELLKSIPPEIEIVSCTESSIIAENFKRMDFYSTQLDKAAFIDVLSGLLKEIFYNLITSKDSLSTLPTQISPLLSKAIEYINENLYTIKDVKEISDTLFITEPYFFKLFKSQLKITPKKYINTKRLLHAQKMIRRGKKPIDVYIECGFETYVGFYKQYVKTFGYSPSNEKIVTTI